MKKSEESLQDLWDKMNHIYIYIYICMIEAPEKEDKKKGAKGLFI